ncbi:MAG: ABC transporter ATP-binding protein [Planctomycetes bacterium]|nr:ABC transporter ATP-binding protein [Planctomycetota bacterium]
MIEIQHLTKRFGALTAVDDVTFDVGRGEVLGFLGPNGAGKSTTMKMVTGFLDPTSGTARVCGHDVTKDPIAAQKRIGYLPEGAPLYGDMTALGLLKFVAEARGIPSGERKAAIERVVSRVHIEEVLRRRIDTLSKGFKRRVGLAQAIVHDPDVLILDEPTDGLDPNQKHDVRQLILEMSKDKVIVLSTHILEEVSAVCTRAIIIAHGKLRFDGTPAELQAMDPAHGAVTLTLDGAQDAREALTGIAGVARVEPLDAPEGHTRYRIYPNEDAAILGGLSSLAHQRGWEVDHLSVESGRLDEVFRTVTAGNERS